MITKEQRDKAIADYLAWRISWETARTILTQYDKEQKLNGGENNGSQRNNEQSNRSNH